MANFKWDVKVYPGMCIIAYNLEHKGNRYYLLDVLGKRYYNQIKNNEKWITAEWITDRNEFLEGECPPAEEWR